jgi:hypothetical protein
MTIKVGDRIELNVANPNSSQFGTVQEVSEDGRVEVKWDDGKVFHYGIDDFEVEVPGRDERDVLDKKTDAKEVVVDCDDNCGALRDPKTSKEIWKAYQHWRHHKADSGCSHGQ